MRYQEPLVHFFGRPCSNRRMLDAIDTFQPSSVTCSDCLADLSAMVLAWLEQTALDSWR